MKVNDNIKDRFMFLLNDISKGVYEKDEELKLALLAALSGESILLLGPPGVAKSMIARKIKYAFKNARSFDYLMSRFSTTDEVFGPVSISKLKISDSYERNIDGYLPTADVVFLDEIWKAGPSIQNTLLTVINEKLFRNGNIEIRLPLKVLIGASNELPAQGEGLEALWDRFIIRIVCKSINDEENFYKMLLDDEGTVPVKTKYAISNTEFSQWQKDISNVVLPVDVLQTISEIRYSLKSVIVKGSNVHRDIYVSDRRWKKIVMLLKSSAFMNGRDVVDTTDIFIVHHCLWNNPEEYEDVKQIVMKSINAPLTNRLKRMRNLLNSDLRVINVNRALKEIAKSGVDAQLKIYDNFYYYILGHGTGNTYIFITDLHRLKIQSADEIKGNVTQTQGIMYHPSNEPQRTVIRLMTDVGKEAAVGGNLENVNLYRDFTHLYINGVRYDIDMLATGERQKIGSVKTKSVRQMDYESEIENVATEISDLEKQLSTNMFISESDCRVIEHYFNDVKKDVALMRVDIEKLIYG
jgi:MoxR-like ATPase